MSGPKTVRVLAAHIPMLSPGVSLSETEEEAMRKRLAESVHLSHCAQRGEPTPEGYVWWVLDHEPGAPHHECDRVLDILATYGNWRVLP